MPTTHSGFLIQGSGGATGNFELVVPSTLGGLVHCWRNNDDPFLPWVGPTFFGSGDVQAISLIQSTFGPPGLGHLEVVARAGDHLVLYWRGDGPHFNWNGPFPFATGVAGNPALVQSRFGNVGNFELVVPLASGGLAHFGRDNDTAGLPWSGPTVFGAAAGQVDAVALIQSTFGDPGNLEVIARAGNQLISFWRDSGPPFTWHGPFPVPLAGVPPGAAPAGVPAFIQSHFGGMGNFDVVTPLSTGGMAHLWRDNDTAGLPWSPPTVFGSDVVSAVALIQSSFGTPGLGSFEVVARVGDRVEHYWRQDQPPFAWTGPTAVIYQEPTGNPAIEGEWRIPYSSTVVGVHANLLHTGNVLFHTYLEAGHHDDDHDHDHGTHQAHGKSCVLNPVSGAQVTLPIAKNLFCAGQTFLPDGRLLVAGGNFTGVQSLHTFTPSGDAGAWQDIGLMSGGDRWYPTCTTLPDGRVLILSGSKNGGGPTVNAHTCELVQPTNDTCEFFNPATNSPTPAQPATIINGAGPYTLFPFVFVLPSGKLVVHAGQQTYFFNPATGQFDDIQLTTISPTARTYPATGTAVLLPLLPDSGPAHAARVLLIGGAGASCPTTANAGTPATSTCEILDLTSPAPAWQHAAPMLHPRVMPDAVLLPDATVLVMNGSSTGVADDGINPVLVADLYDPATDSWAAMRPMRVPRLYHSTALLLPDGRVLTAGKDEEFNPDPFKYSEYRIEVFSPPYLFRGPRPVITSAPATIAYGASFTVQTLNGAAISTAALLRTGAVTHSFNANQRYVGLAVTAHTASSVTLQAPPTSAIAPPGHYMLFLLNGAGVPSIGHFLIVG